MNSSIQNILSTLKGYRFDLSSEKELQLQIQSLLNENGIDVKPEYRLSETDIVDFYTDGLAIEVKIKGSATAIHRQCKRYVSNNDVSALLLITNRSIGFPKEINNKPCYVLTLGQAWL